MAVRHVVAVFNAQHSNALEGEGTGAREEPRKGTRDEGERFKDVPSMLTTACEVRERERERERTKESERGQYIERESGTEREGKRGRYIYIER